MESPSDHCDAPETHFTHEYVPPKDGMPVVLLLHGKGMDEKDMLAQCQGFPPGIGFLSIRGKVIDSKGRRRFFKKAADGSSFDMQDLAQRGKEIVQFLEWASTTYGFTPDNVVILGYSNGSNMAQYLLRHYGQLFRAGILWRTISQGSDCASDLTGKPI